MNYVFTKMMLAKGSLSAAQIGYVGGTRGIQIITDLDHTLERGVYTLYVELDAKTKPIEFGVCTYSQADLTVKRIDNSALQTAHVVSKFLIAFASNN